jgi:prolipoprotein diacylglyceryltransferase
MIPYFPPLRFHLFGPLYIHAFGVLVAAAVIAGWRMATARCRRKGLDTEFFQDLLLYVIGMGFLGAHLYSVLAYFPEEALKQVVANQVAVRYTAVIGRKHERRKSNPLH